MNPLLKKSSGKQGKKGKKGCLFLIIGCFATILATALFVLIVSKTTGVIIESRHGSEAAYALLSLTIPCYTIAFVLFNAILALWYIAPTEEEVRAQNKGLSPMLGQKEARAMSAGTKWLITAVILVAVVLTGAVAANTYRLVTPHGVSSYFFVETKSYEWKQVTGYTVDCENDNDGLSITFTMRDGKQYEILQGINSTTEKFDEQYTSVTHFAYDLDQRMVELQVPRNTRHMERAVKLYRDHALWPYVSKLIGYVELVPQPDETAEVTEAPSEETTEPSEAPTE
jgi:hypothetical protein